MRTIAIATKKIAIVVSVAALELIIKMTSSRQRIVLWVSRLMTWRGLREAGRSGRRTAVADCWVTSESC